MSERVVDVVQMFQQAAFEVTGKKVTGITQETVISTLGMDSVQVMELVGIFEEKTAANLVRPPSTCSM